MRIGIDACCWSNRRGYGRFTRELLLALAEHDRSNQYIALVDARTADGNDFPRALNPLIVKTSKPPTQAAAALGRRSIRDVLAFSRAAQKQHFDLFFFPTVYSYFPLLQRIKVILGIHDVMAEQQPQLIFPSRKDRLFWRLKMRMALKQASLIVTVSEHARMNILEQFKLPKSLVRVVPEAPARLFSPVQDDAKVRETLDRYNLNPERRFLLYVGGMGPHKNLDTLIKAYATLIQDQRFADVALVIVGDKEDVFYSQFPALKKSVQQLNLDKSVTFTGFIPDEDLACFYSAAQLFIMPSFDEGFGLPAMEAMACGAPVAVSHAGALPEVVGEAGLLFDPFNAQELQEAISYVLLDRGLRETMRAKGLERAAQFTWQQTAHAIKGLFEEVAKTY